MLPGNYFTFQLNIWKVFRRLGYKIIWKFLLVLKFGQCEQFLNSYNCELIVMVEPYDVTPSVINNQCCNPVDQLINYRVPASYIALAWKATKCNTILFKKLDRYSVDLQLTRNEHEQTVESFAIVVTTLIEYFRWERRLEGNSFTQF